MATTNSTGFLTTSQAGRMFGLSHVTIIHHCQQGDLEFHQTSGGHRRVSLKSCREFFNGETFLDEQSSDGERGVVIYARTSSESQKESLTRQIERLRLEVSQREGLSQDSIPVYSDIASSFGSRESLNKLVDAIIDGKVSRIYCEYLDRLSRVPALTRLLEHLCEKFNVEIICLDIEDSVSQEIYQKELLGFLTVWCNRQSAAKSRKVTFKAVEKETIERMLELRKQGLTAKAIMVRLNAEGHTMKVGDKVEGISYAKVRSVIDSNGNQTALTHFVGMTEIEDSIKSFAERSIVKTSEASRISTMTIYPKYVEFCNGRSVSPQPANIFGKSLVKLLGKQNKKTGGVWYWVGYSVN